MELMVKESSREEQTQINTRERIRYIDVARGIAIILVVIGHIWTSGTLREWIYSFHMPFFFILSGLVSTYDTKNVNELLFKIRQNIRRYVVPHFLMMLVAGEGTWENIINYTISTRTILAQYPLTAKWFLPCLFIASLYVLFTFRVTGLIKNFQIRCIARIVIMILFLALGFHFDGSRCGHQNPWMWNVALMAAFFIIMGSISKPCLKWFTDVKRICWGGYLAV